MISPELLSAIADQIGLVQASHVLMGQLAPAINLLIDAALIALLLYILIAARKGR